MGGVHLHYDEIISGSERGTYQKVFRSNWAQRGACCCCVATMVNQELPGSHIRGALLRALTEKLKRTSARRSQGQANRKTETDTVY